MKNLISNGVKTKISHSLALLALVIAAVLIENAFLQSMSINNQAYDLIAKTTINQMSPQNFNLMKAGGQVALADAFLPLFPGAKRLTFGDNGLVRYRIDAPLNTVAKFYNQVMSSVGWQQIKSSAQAMVSQENFDKVMIALAENPITKKTEAIFYHQPLGGNDLLGARTALAEEAVINNAPQESVQPAQPLSPTQPQPSLPPADNQNSQTPPPAGDNNQPFPSQQPMQPNGQQPNNINNNFQPQQNNMGPQPTCRVNGVETPGGCPQFNNNGGGQNMNTMEFTRPQGEGNNGQQGPNNNGGGNNGQQGPQFNNNGGNNNGQPGGPSEEQQKKMDEQRLKDMKRGMSQFSRSITMMKKNVAKNKTALSKCGVSIPEELTNALNSSDSLVAKINSAKTADELDEVIGDIQDVGSVMQDWGPRMGDLNRLCQMFKQADRDQKQLDRSLASYTKKNSAKMDISEILAEYKTNIDGMRQTLAQAKELAKTDPDEALSKIEDDFYGSMDNVRNSEQAINMVLNISKGIRDAATEIKKIESNIKSLKKKKLDTSAIEELTVEFKQNMGEIKTMIKTKFDVDELVSKVETAFDVREQINDAMQEFGVGMMAPQIKANNNMNVQVNLPDAFKKQDNNGGDNSGQGDNQNGPGMNNPQPQNMKPQL